MNVQQYIERKKSLRKFEPKYRQICRNCLQPKQWCYCNELQPFDCKMTFVILLHPLELRRRIASGRMSHLMLKNSHLILGHNYSDDVKVNQLLANPDYFPVILHLGENSINLSNLSEDQKVKLCPADKQILIFVVDGTWNTASKTVRLSRNLRSLPRISFTPTRPSAFRVRRQPKPKCYSTLEAIHQTIELLGTSQGFDLQSRKHDAMLHVFNSFVDQQATYVQQLKERIGLQYRNYSKTN